MRPFRVGDILVSSFIERDGPWRAPSIMFPTADRDTALAHLRNMPPEVYDAAQDLLVITYQTFVVRTAKHNILIDTCVPERDLHLRQEGIRGVGGGGGRGRQRRAARADLGRQLPAHRRGRPGPAGRGRFRA
mgnify:CR=1 FL=1